MYKVIIDRELCKGCGLCIRVCPEQILKFDENLNSKGFSPVKCINEEKCIGCTMCAQICPDIVFEIYKKEVV